MCGDKRSGCHSLSDCTFLYEYGYETRIVNSKSDGESDSDSECWNFCSLGEFLLRIYVYMCVFSYFPELRIECILRNEVYN